MVDSKKREKKTVSRGWVKPDFKKLEDFESNILKIAEIEVSNLKTKLESIKNVLETIKRTKSS